MKNFSPTCLKLFEREVEIHRTLDHEHIVRCYDVYKTKTHIYMIMEYCPHGDLSSFIKQKKKLAEHYIIDIMSQRRIKVSHENHFKLETDNKLT